MILGDVLTNILAVTGTILAVAFAIFIMVHMWRDLK